MATTNPVHEYLSVPELEETRNGAAPQWKPVINEAIKPDIYEISNTGLCSNKSTGKLLKPRAVPNGTLLVVSMKGTNPSGSTSMRLDKMVLEAFTVPQPEGMIPIHADGDDTNNALSNLSWGTPPEGTKVRKPAVKKKKAPAKRPHYSDKMQIDRRYRLRGVTAIVHEDFSVELTVPGARGPMNLNAENFAALAQIALQIQEMNKLVGGAR